ncbi:MAG: LPO_1073/Vpar_1526 family protein [Thermoplasmata archaeon]
MDAVSAGMVAAIGGVAGKLVERTWTSGEKWLKSFFKDHQPAAQQKAQQNALDFLNELANRVHEIESTIKDNSRYKKFVDDALSDPDFSALLKDAMIHSSRTDSNEKHKLLAQLVSERLHTSQGSMVAAACNLACSTIPYLTSDQLRCLGVMCILYEVRPHPRHHIHIKTNRLEKSTQTTQEEQDIEYWTNWLSKTLGPMLPIKKMGRIDYAHLESFSCIRRTVSTGNNTQTIDEFIESTIPSLRLETTLKVFGGVDKATKENRIFRKYLHEKLPQYHNLSEIWKSGIRFARLSTTGMMIGASVIEMLANTKVYIKWDDDEHGTTEQNEPIINNQRSEIATDVLIKKPVLELKEYQNAGRVTSQYMHDGGFATGKLLKTTRKKQRSHQYKNKISTRNQGV